MRILLTVLLVCYSVPCFAQDDGPILLPLSTVVARPTPRHEDELLARHERRMQIGIDKAKARRDRLLARQWTNPSVVVYVFENHRCYSPGERR
jgi:hypothetical protein